MDAKGKKVAWALNHEDVPGAGAARRRQIPRRWRGSAVMGEFARGTLRSGGSGDVVKAPAQARAIAASEGNTPKKERAWRRAHHD
jgi:hypothetical protein